MKHRKDASPCRKRNGKTNTVQNGSKPIKIIVLGSDGVGKSALTVRLLTRRFIGEYDSTLEATYRHQVEVDSECVSIELMDTAGENSSLKLNQCLSRGDILLLLYSITDQKSFEEATRIASFAREQRTAETIVMTLIGTKKDLDHFREVDETEAKKYADELDSGFYELSTADSEGYQEITDVIKSCVQQFLKDKKDRTTKNNNNSSLVKMKEGLIRRTGSFRRKSVAF